MTDFDILLCYRGRFKLQVENAAPPACPSKQTVAGSVTVITGFKMLDTTIMTTAALNMVLTMIFMLSACTAEDGTGREPLGGDSNDEIGVDAKLPTGDASIDNVLASKVFRSIEKKEVGLGPDGAQLGHWYIDFSSSTFKWVYSDVSESGTYVLDDKRVIGQSGNRQILGEYDPESGILTWDGTDYGSVEASEQP